MQDFFSFPVIMGLIVITIGVLWIILSFEPMSRWLGLSERKSQSSFAQKPLLLAISKAGMGLSLVVVGLAEPLYAAISQSQSNVELHGAIIRTTSISSGIILLISAICYRVAEKGVREVNSEYNENNN